MKTKGYILYTYKEEDSLMRRIDALFKFLTQGYKGR
jgi:hypothetical protein